MRIEEFKPVVMFDEPSELDEFCLQWIKTYMIVLIETRPYAPYRAAKFMGQIVYSTASQYYGPISELQYPVKALLMPTDREAGSL